MPKEYERLRNKPVPFENCPKCHKGFEPFLRGLVQRTNRWFWIGPRRDYCALICRACKMIVGWETPPRPCLSMEQINKVTYEYWNRKTLEKIYGSRSPLLEAISKGTLKELYKGRCS